MVTQLHQTTPEQDAHQRLRESVQRVVLDETQGGRRIVRSVVSIMEGDASGSTPWHQLEAAKLLLKLGFEDARATLGSIHKQGRKAAPSNAPSPLMGDGWDGGDAASDQQSHMNPEQVKLNKKLVRHIRVDTGDGTTMVKFLIDVVEGNEPEAKVKDRIEAAKVLLHLCFDNPAQPDPEFMMFYAPCHPDCLCVCKDLPEDHPEVVQAHTPPTDEQREQWATEAEMMERAAESAELKAAQKARADRDWKLQQYHSPDTVEERRLEREELRKKRQIRREEEQERDQERRQEMQLEHKQEMQLAREQELETVRRRERLTDEEARSEHDLEHQQELERDHERLQAITHARSP